MRTFLFVFLTILQNLGMPAIASAAPSSEGQFGIGVEFFGPAGLSLYNKLDSNHFLQAALAFNSDGDFTVTGDYVFANQGDLFHNPHLTPYWGVGALLLHEDDERLIYHHRHLHDGTRTYLGGRIPLGLNFVIPSTPVQIGAETVPSLLLIPSTDVFLSAAVHVRVLF